MNLVDLFFFLGAFASLFYAAKILVRSLISIARYLNIHEHPLSFLLSEEAKDNLNGVSGRK